MVTKLHIFNTKKFQRWTIIILVIIMIRLDSALEKDGNSYPQIFLKECKYIKKKVIRLINDKLCDFSSSDYSDDSNKE